MVLPKIKEVLNILNFAKKVFTKGSFRHIGNYVTGLIASYRKTARNIARESVNEKHPSALDRMLREAKFDREKLEERYLKKIRYLFKSYEPYLLLDDTLDKREGKNIEETQSHFDHNTNSYVTGHQYFTSIIYTPFLQMPLFPELYSKNTDSKIEMAQKLVDKLKQNSIRIHTVLFDSWYSDAELINKCKDINARVICAIKTNRNIKFDKTRKWRKLSFITERINPTGYPTYSINNKGYNVADYKIKLKKVNKLLKFLVSHEYHKKKESWSKIHLISTDHTDNPEEILRAYKIRWCIETYHRDIKQNLGFADAHLRKREGIVSHAILVSIAYAILKLFLYRKGINQTIGECCSNLRDKSIKNLLKGIIEIEDRSARIIKLEEVFINKSEAL